MEARYCPAMQFMRVSAAYCGVDAVYPVKI